MAIKIFTSSGWAMEVPLVICMNCKIIHRWLENSMQYSWELAKEIVEIVCLLRSLLDYRLQLIDREDNVLASILAREGLNKDYVALVGAWSWHCGRFPGDCCFLLKCYVGLASVGH
ncbi:hypothetical protein V6N13_088458 [Hibiscus sabdariffa]